MVSKSEKGFTLIELMIVVAIIAIIAAFAYFNYGKYAFRARRSEGQSWVRNVAAAEERFFSTYNNYTTLVTTAPPTGLGFASASSLPNSYYTVAVVVAGTTVQPTYSITATPAGPQTNDKCGSLTMTNLGTTSFSGDTSNGKCW
jgi:type IV pilus assembly protein PilE